MNDYLYKSLYPVTSGVIMKGMDDNQWTTWTNYMMDMVLNKGGTGNLGKLIVYGDGSKIEDVRKLCIPCYGLLGARDDKYSIVCLFGSDNKLNVYGDDAVMKTGVLSVRLDSIPYVSYYYKKQLLVYIDKAVSDPNELLRELFNMIVEHIGKKDKGLDYGSLEKFTTIMNKCYDDMCYDINKYDEYVNECIYAPNLDAFLPCVDAMCSADKNRLFNTSLEIYMYCKELLVNLDNYKQIAKNKMRECKEFLQAYNPEMNDLLSGDAFKKSLLKYKAINVVAFGDKRIDLLVDTYLKTWSRCDLKILLKNKYSDIMQVINNTLESYSLASKLHLFVDIFFNKVYKIRTQQTLCIKTSDSEWEIFRGVRFNSSQSIPNPHINEHDCFTSARIRAIECFRSGDYDTGFMQLIAAVQSITVTDNTVMREFIYDYLFTTSTYDVKMLYDKNGVAHSVHELLDTVYNSKTTMPDMDALSDNDVAKEVL